MWKLKNVQKEHLEHYIFVGEDCVVGRKDSSILIANDPSVSRRHAVLFVKHPEENLGDPSKKSSLFLRDEGSKYGTFKNSLRVTGEVEMEDGDIVKFGQFESEFSVHKLPIVVTTSCLDMFARKDLKKTIHFLGGYLVSEWQPTCSHLVMSEVKVTVKALCCLVSAKPIVTPLYFQELKNSLKASGTSVPDNQFIPPIGESLIDKDKVSFDVNLQRKNVFDGKNFFFMDEKQFKKLHLGIVLGNGKATIFSQNNFNIDLLSQEGCCFIEPVKESVPKEMKSSLERVQLLLQKKKLRMIPESDIGLAVAYCSTEKFCNPEFNFGAAVLSTPKVQSQTLTEREVYVPDTEETVASPSCFEIEQKPKKLLSEAYSSLNLTSVCKDLPEDMEVSEIPLSAQIKRELDDIFDDITLESKIADTSRYDDLPSTQPVHEESYSQKKKSHKKIKIKEDVIEEVHSPGEESPFPIARSPQQKIEHTLIDDKEQFFRDTAQVVAEQQLPRNLMKIEVVPLLYRKPKDTPVLLKTKNSPVKNFKKFRKVLPLRAQTLPRIIGGSDLIAYDKDAAKICNEIWEDPLEDEDVQPAKGEFDW